MKAKQLPNEVMDLLCADNESLYVFSSVGQNHNLTPAES